LYAFIDRQNLPGTFRTFDLASPDATSAQRFTTTVPQQALFMMNSPFAIQESRKLSARDAKQVEPAQRLAALYRTVLQRDPTPAETQMAVKFVQTEDSATQPLVDVPVPWTYGFGAFDEAANRIASFEKL